MNSAASTIMRPRSLRQQPVISGDASGSAPAHPQQPQKEAAGLRHRAAAGAGHEQPALRRQQPHRHAVERAIPGQAGSRSQAGIAFSNCVHVYVRAVVAVETIQCAATSPAGGTLQALSVWRQFGRVQHHLPRHNKASGADHTANGCRWHNRHTIQEVKDCCTFHSPGPTVCRPRLPAS